MSVSASAVAAAETVDTADIAAGIESAGAVQLLRPDGQLLDLGTRTDQVYSFETEEGWQYHWAIAEATKRAEASCELSTVSLSDAGMTVELVRAMNRDLDEAYALTTNLLKPLLFVPFQLEEGEPETVVRTTEHVLIDGWHRVFKAAHMGVDILPCYVLSQHDADACLIIKFPPHEGLPWNVNG